MLHRMALRVLPSLSLAVTEDSVRKRKRVVMFVPGLVAFGVYRWAKQAVPLTEPLVLLGLCGMVGMVTALLAFQVGRKASWRAIAAQDTPRFLAWLAGWIGFAYGVQLALLVLALLWVAGYSYLQHPDGPAMMAIIISCTAVARDAFEIGHVRKIQILGRPIPTFPDGAALRRLLADGFSGASSWGVAGLALGAGLGFCGIWFDQTHAAALAQLVNVTLVGGGLALCAYFAGWSPPAWFARLRQTAPAELLKYWWWPGLAFASTYYLVAMGAALFVLREPAVGSGLAVLAGSLVTGLMGLYGYYLGHRRRIEDQEQPRLTEGMLRCPFVMGILGKTQAASASAGEMALSKTGIKG